MAGKHTYIDQRGTEIYDSYDLRDGEGPVPQMLLDAIPPDAEDYSTIQVNIDYPYDGIWSLDGQVGYATWYAELGKKAFIHGGFYDHPAKYITAEIQYMEPWDYIEWCAHNFKVDIEDLIKSRLNDYDLDQVFGHYGSKIFYPVIEVEGGQEGLHRAIWAMMNDIPEIPVIVIDKRKP